MRGADEVVNLRRPSGTHTRSVVLSRGSGRAAKEAAPPPKPVAVAPALKPRRSNSLEPELTFQIEGNADLLRGIASEGDILHRSESDEAAAEATAKRSNSRSTFSFSKQESTERAKELGLPLHKVGCFPHPSGLSQPSGAPPTRCPARGRR